MGQKSIFLCVIETKLPPHIKRGPPLLTPEDDDNK